MGEFNGKGNSVRFLVDRDGLGIKVQSKSLGCAPFTVIHDNGKTVVVKYSDGRKAEILSEYPGCNDYEVI